MSREYAYKYFECIDDRFPERVLKVCERVPHIGHIYSVRSCRSQDHPGIQGEEAYLLWEIRNHGADGKPDSYFRANRFREIEETDIAPILDLDPVAVDEINTRFMFRVDKLRRMCAGVSSSLKSYHDGIMEIDVISGNAGYFSNKKPHQIFRNIPAGWRRNPELKAAGGFRMRIFLSRQIQGFITSAQKAESTVHEIQQHSMQTAKFRDELMIEMKGCLYP